MKLGMIFAAGALAAAGIAVTPAPAEARTYVSIGFGNPGYYGGYYDRGYYGRGAYGRPYGYYGRGYYGRDRWRGGGRWNNGGRWNGGGRYYGRPVQCRIDRWGRERCRRVRW